MASSTIFSGVKLTWLGHASVLLEGDGIAVYVDPYVVPKGSREADLILYTHGHFDHCVSAPSITKHSTVLMGAKSCKLPIRLLEIGSKEKAGPVSIEAVPAYNIGKPFHPKGEGVGYIIRFRTASVYVAGDTDFIPEMKGYRCDIAVVPIGGKYTMDEAEAAEAIAAIAPKVAIPYHFNYLAETKADPAKFKSAVEQKTGGKVDVRILEPAR
ncbi:MAG: MBL fold metallo-hydrolase [Candidatus Micrarchaeota archaeon]|nr:MBL fold metallo-hydrolase [Candidatus Micrarchaeota archaeon]